MVLSSPAAPDAVPSGRWLDRLSLILQLGREQGVMVLVRGGPERLGDLVRRVIEVAPDADVLVRADALASLPPRSTVILCLRSEDFDWLNMARPVVRGHRIVLFGDSEMTLCLEQRAFDFFDWISHRIEAPSGPPPFAVRALQRAACARAPQIVWRGGDLDASFAAALPGRTLVRASAGQSYDNLVKALRPAPRIWVAITDLDDSLRVQRARWASAEAGRYGRTIFVNPSGDLDRVRIAHANPVSMEEAVNELSAAGVRQGPRVAALLDLDPEAIQRAVAMARAGASGAEIEVSAEELRRPPEPPRNLGARHLPNWYERVESALSCSDLEVARRWASQWRDSSGGGAIEEAALARILALSGQAEEASNHLRAAHDSLSAAASAEERFEVLRAEGFVRSAEGEHDAALRAFKSALDLARALGKSPEVVEVLLANRALALIALGRLDDADRMLSSWISSPERGARPFPVTFEGAFAAARLRLAQGRIDAASALLENALRTTPPDDEMGRRAALTALAETRLRQGRYADADLIYRRLVDSAERHGHDTMILRRAWASALANLGRFADAEAELRHTLRTAEGRRAAHVRAELAGSVLAQGRVEEAQHLLEGVLASHEDNPTLLAYALPLQARLEDLRGNRVLGVDLRRRALEAQVRARFDPGTVLSTTLDLARSLLASDRPADAEPLLKRAAAEGRRLGDSLNEALALTLLAEAQGARGFAHARDTARRALEVWRNTGQEPSAAIRKDLLTLAGGGRAAPSRRAVDDA